MGARTLNLKMSELQAHVGDYLGWGRGPDFGDEEWTPQKLSRINQILDTALRWVYFEATTDDRPPHQWSWLTPLCDITLESGERHAPLPSDFGGFAEHYLIITSSGSGTYNRVAIMDPSFVESRYAVSSTPTGRPVYASVEFLKGTEIDRSNREWLSVYPRSDQAYRLRAKYNVLGDALTAANPYAYGGTAMAETFRRACRAAAEADLDNLRPGEGTEWVHYQSSLRSAILREGRHQPKILGRNTDRSDPSNAYAGRGAWWRHGIGWVDPTTIDGVIPE